MGGWKAIDSAPKDRRVVLFYPECGFTEHQMVFGRWNADGYSKNPRPYWSNDCERWWGVVRCRTHSPTMWMDLEPPKDGQ